MPHVPAPPPHPLVVQVCDFPANGQGYYRHHEPSRHLGRLGVAVVDCDPLHRLLPLLVAAADVLVLQTFDWEWVAVARRRRERGQATVVEASDDYFDVLPWNSGSLAWSDASRREALRQLLAAADAAQTTTPHLARRWAPWARHVAVFANQLPDVPPLEPRRGGPLTVGWAGSSSHLADWYAFAPVVQAWLTSRPDVRLAVMTDDVARSFVRLPAERYLFRGAGTLAEYLSFLRTLDVGLAPLLPSDFNRGRSDLKFLEYAAHGVAGVYSDFGPFSAAVKDGETGLLFRNGDELRACLDRLADDAHLRDGIRRRAHAEVSSRRLSDHVGERLRFYRGLLPHGARGVLPADMAAAAVRDGDYYQLRQGQPEQTLAASIRRPGDADAISSLSRLTHEQPRYTAALLQLGHLLNEAGRFDEALVPLDQALGQDPDDGRGLCEMARALAGIEQVPAARECLERALAVNPCDQRAWARLLALPEVADPERFGRAAEMFPESGRFAALYGEALERAGRRDEAWTWHARALELGRRDAAPGDARLRLALIAEYARRHSGGALAQGAAAVEAAHRLGHPPQLL